MDISTVQGVIFLAILVIACFLLADGNLIPLRLRPKKIWLLRPGYHRRRFKLRVLLGMLFCSLLGWLVHSRSELYGVKAQKASFGAEVVQMRAR